MEKDECDEVEKAESRREQCVRCHFVCVFMCVAEPLSLSSKGLPVFSGETPLYLSQL